MTETRLPRETPSRRPGWLDARFVARLVASPRGRAFFLNLMADAEVADEGMVFETLLARVDDPELGRLVRRHQADELRHNAMLLECVARTGVDPGPVPPHLRFAQRLDATLGGFAEAFLGGREGVMRAYLLLLTLEKRAVERYPFIVRGLAAADPWSARVVAEVLRDEERHVRYARAIARRYAPDDATLGRELARFEAAEAEAFAAHGVVFLRHVVDHDLLGVGPVERLGWCALAALGELRGGADRSSSQAPVRSHA